MTCQLRVTVKRDQEKIQPTGRTNVVILLYYNTILHYNGVLLRVGLKKHLGDVG